MTKALVYPSSFLRAKGFGMLKPPLPLFEPPRLLPLPVFEPFGIVFWMSAGLGTPFSGCVAHQAAST